MSLDLVLYQEYIQANLAGLKEIAKQTRGILVIVGFIDQDLKKIGPDGTPYRYNSAALIYNGRLLGIVDKTLLPDYDIFFENRYFQPARQRQVFDFKGVKIGVEICEDLWDENYPVKVSDELVVKGAQILINVSASPFYAGKRLVRQKIIQKVVGKNKVPFVYVNLVGGQDGFEGEVVFDGQSMVFDKSGNLVSLGKIFAEDLFFVDFKTCEKKGNENLKPQSNPTEELYNALVFGIKEYCRRTGFEKAFIGLSGGIDSAVTAVLAVSALGAKNVTGISMPSRYSSQASKDDAVVLAKNLGIKFKTIPIKDAFTAFKNTLKGEFAGLPENTTEENIQARIRGILLMAHANKFGGLVINTGNKTETALGYTTLYGDMCGGLAAISDVSKLKIYKLARFINQGRDHNIIPENIIQKVPSAELKDNQTDEESLGASYKIMSPLVDEIVEKAKTPKKLSKYPKNVVWKLFTLINKSEYKRRQAPPGIKVTPKSFGIGRRIPMNYSFWEK